MNDIEKALQEHTSGNIICGIHLAFIGPTFNKTKQGKEKQKKFGVDLSLRMIYEFCNLSITKPQS